MFIQCIAVGVGGFIGSVFRYLISLIPTLHKGVIPWQTCLLYTSYQEWEKEAQELYPGDVVVIPAGVKHWHGAAPDSWFAHLAVEIPGEKTANEWCEPVSDEEYGKLE